MANYYTTHYTPELRGFDLEHGPLSINTKGFDRNDDEIAANISERFAGLFGIDTDAVEVAIEKNIVTLSGSVQSRQIATFLAAIAGNVQGVRSVVNQLQTEISKEASSVSST